MKIPKELTPGYLGELTPDDARMIAAELAKSAKLRELWGVKKRATYPLVMIARLSMPEAPAEGERLMRQKLSAETTRRARKA